MKKRMLCNMMLIIIMILLAFGTTILGAINEKEDYKNINNESGYALFYENYTDGSIADVYTPDEAIERLKRLQEGVSDIDQFYYLTNIAFDGVDDANIIGTALQKELGAYLKKGDMIDPEYHITDMKNILIPAMISEEMESQYRIGDTVKGEYNGIPIYLSIVGVLSKDNYIECIDTSFSTFTIPKLCFDAKANSEDEKIMQEWFLSATVGGLVVYESADEYQMIASKLQKITEDIGLEWKLEDRVINRYAELDIPVSEATAYLFVFAGIAFLFLHGMVYSYDYLKTKKIGTYNVVTQTKIVLTEIIHVLGCYIMFLLGAHIVLRNSIYLHNFSEEKGSVLFCLIAYLLIVCLIICNKRKEGTENECN